MVLQRAPYHAVVWGYSPNIGERIIIRVSDTEQIYKAIVEKGPDGVNGIWKVKLNPENRTIPFVITAISSTGSRSIANVLFGDVWLCSGQSNMQFTVNQTYNASQIVDEASQYTSVRLFTVAETQSPYPAYDLIEVQQPWSMANKESVGFAPWKYFSSVCWLFGKSLYDKKQYPIGLIATDWGGTPVEAWSSVEALSKCGLQAGQYPVEEEWFGVGATMGNSVLWNAMVHPMINMTIYGAIWYQGEANQVVNVNKYNCTFPTMIDDWRLQFSQAGDTNPLFPFGFVQLAANRLDPSISTGFPDIRWHQTADYGLVPNKRMPNVFMSVAMDLPDFFSPDGSIHPRDKQDVAIRLVLSGLAVAYNDTVPEWQGPLPNQVSLSPTEITLDFSAEIEVRTVEGFEICCSVGGGDECISSKSWWLPTPIVSKTTKSINLYPICATGENILGIRYSWRESPCQFKKCAIYSTLAELPGPPFVWYKSSSSSKQEKPQVYSVLWDKPQINSLP
ncbi:hypothetical protein SNE40_020075 [Patella caerulea]|uniref:Sialate O-acetylesterase domain-containing protein n=1 Tax=Patella caerulea TaxID=87958 RepID=A0AAN8J031_PATCE